MLAWPYYSLLDLRSQSSIYTSSHHAMYQGVLQRSFPALVATGATRCGMRGSAP